MAELAKFLRAAREKAGLTQTEVGQHMGYANSQFVSNWERARSIPPLNALRPLSKMYHINMDSLFEQVLQQSLKQLEMNLRKQYAAIKKKKA